MESLPGRQREAEKSLTNPPLPKRNFPAKLSIYTCFKRALPSRFPAGLAKALYMLKNKKIINSSTIYPHLSLTEKGLQLDSR